MANEAVCIETPTKFARYTVADGTGIAIGTLLKITDPNTAAASSADNDKFAGIAWEEKTASDGITEISVALDGVFDLTCTDAAITAGQLVNLSGANVVAAAVDGDFEAGSIVGRSLETSTTTEVLRVRLLGF